MYSLDKIIIETESISVHRQVLWQKFVKKMMCEYNLANDTYYLSIKTTLYFISIHTIKPSTRW